MPTDIDDDRGSAGKSHETRSFPNAGGLREPLACMFGSNIAERNIDVARKAYIRYAEVVEYVFNTFEATTYRVSRDFYSVTGGAGESLRHCRETGSALVHEMLVRAGDQVARGSSAAKSNAARGRADLLDVALRGQIAADTNVRAYFDCLRDLANASTAQGFVSAQTSFLWDQWRRSLLQTLDLRRRTVGALRKAMSAPAI